MGLDDMFGMDMDASQPRHPGLGAMDKIEHRQANQERNEEEMLREMLRKAKEMFPQWPPVAQYMWAQGQIQNFQSNKPPANPQFPMLNNPNYKMTY